MLFRSGDRKDEILTLADQLVKSVGYESFSYADLSEKLGITLNMGTKKGKEIFPRLVAMADIVAENFAAGVMERLGFGYEQLKAIKPDIIYLSNCGFGATGPYQPFKTWGPIVQAISGLTYTSGIAGQAPAGWGYSYMDVTGGWCGGLGMMMGLLRMKRTGEGVYVDYAVTEAAMAMLGPFFLDYQVNGRGTDRPDFPPGNHSEWPGVAPHNTYRCAGIDRQGHR